ncbi:MAG: hypothetical protein GWP19_00555 [Planctomycetia bacterium]|nr:hypothetical protein [Planctomycetia bacterium]
MVKVERFRLINKNNLIAAFNLILENMEMTIKDCKLMQGKEPNSRWVGMPSTFYEKDGQKKWYELVYWSKEAKQRLQDEIMPQLEREIANATSNTNQPQIAGKSVFDDEMPF